MSGDGDEGPLSLSVFLGREAMRCEEVRVERISLVTGRMENEGSSRDEWECARGGRPKVAGQVSG